MNYIITKRTECGECKGRKYRHIDIDPLGLGIECGKCHVTGYIDEAIDADEWLLSRLAKLRWDEMWGEHTGTTKEMDNPRFDGDER